MLQTEQLTFSYNNQKTLRFPDINCKRGEQCLLLGQSGCGKTTLLHLLGGLRKPKDGKVLVNGKNIAELSATHLDRFRGEHIGIIFQQSHFVQALTVEENLILAQNLAGVKVDKGRISNLLNRLNVGDKLKSKPKNLSQGEQQRVAIARALVNRPAIILADEPTSALDDTNCEEVIRLLGSQAEKDNVTLLIVTHDGRLKEQFEKKILLEKQ